MFLIVLRLLSFVGVCYPPCWIGLVPPSIEEPRFVAGPSFLFEFCQINSSQVSIFLERLLCLVFECFLSGKLGLWLVASVNTLASDLGPLSGASEAY